MSEGLTWQQVVRVAARAKSLDERRKAGEQRMRERFRLAFRLCRSGRFLGLATWLNCGQESAVEFTRMRRGRIVRRGVRFPTSAVRDPMSRVAKGWPMYVARFAHRQARNRAK